MAGALAFLAMWLAPASTLDAGAIRDVVMRAMPAMNRCGDDVAGPLSFTISPSGAVLRVSGGTACVQRVLMKLHFPAQGETIEISYPLNVDPA